jgi:hypothetical protein
MAPVLSVVTEATVPYEPPVSFCTTPEASVGSAEKKWIEPPKLAWPRSPAAPGPRSTTVAPRSEAGK